MTLPTWIVELTIVVRVHSSTVADTLLFLVIAIPIILFTIHVMHSLLTLLKSMRVIVRVVSIMLTVVMIVYVNLDVYLGVAVIMMRSP